VVVGGDVSGAQRGTSVPDIVVSMTKELLDKISSSAEWNCRSLKSEILVVLKERYKIEGNPMRKRPGPARRKLRSAPKQVIEELEKLAAEGYVHRAEDGRFIGVSRNGAGWRPRLPPPARGVPPVYLATRRTQEEAVLARAIALRERVLEQEAFFRETENDQQAVMDLFGEDPGDAGAIDHTIRRG
jgi:Arc-like DNA binding domain